ncbi:MAG: hypothetical protein EOP22_14025 [Hyphomicrobiales bacterium]|nr:MAG: hypothetical protein EOP22_14025 [Hyphomicrobiales bacterium]
MNTANLQLEGLYIVLASLNNTLVGKGLLSREEVGHALKVAEQTALGDDGTEERSPSHRDAVAFPARLLMLANNGASDAQIQSFSELAKLVGQTKHPHNDAL